MIGGVWMLVIALQAPVTIAGYPSKESCLEAIAQSGVNVRGAPVRAWCFPVFDIRQHEEEGR